MLEWPTELKQMLPFYLLVNKGHSKQLRDGTQTGPGRALSAGASVSMELGSAALPGLLKAP